MTELLPVLAIPVVVVLGALFPPLMSRRRFRRTNGAFPCKLKVESGVVQEWRRRRRPYSVVALWVHDVVVLRGGVFSMRSDHLAVRSADHVRPEYNDMVSVRLTLDTEQVIVLVADDGDLSKLVGPFLIAELEHLTRADS